MPSLRLTCPHCKGRMVIDEAQRGTAVRCQGCGKGVRVPAARAHVSVADAATLPPKSMAALSGRSEAKPGSAGISSDTSQPADLVTLPPPVSASPAQSKVDAAAAEASIPRTLDDPVRPGDSQPTGTKPSAGTGNGFPSVHGYEILGELGRGGMGVVYKARQTGLNRTVALKMILSGAHAGKQELARFKAEGEAVARLQHPNIVQVYEVGEQDGRPYFSLEFCGGGGLDRKLAGNPLPPKEAAKLLEKLASAMQAAHAAKLIHRDLKPANVLLLRDGTPKITDFGLAKKLDEDGATRTGSVMGTPSYMAPEQAGGAKEVGPPADIYSLGVILYELLVGRPPFRAATPLETIMQVVANEPVPPRQLQPTTPRDLETICLKCLEKQPARRYASCQELVDDLRRWQEGQPVQARPIGRVERAVKWSRRRPAVAALVGVSVLAAVLLVTLGLYFLDRLTRERNAAVAERERAEWLVYAGKIALAQRELQDVNGPAAFNILKDCSPKYRHWEYHHLMTRFRSDQTLRGHTGPIECTCFRPDGRQMATASQDKTVKVWDAATGHEILTFRGHSREVSSVCFSPDGKRLASGSWDGIVKIWDAATGSELHTLRGHSVDVTSVAYSPDGKFLVSGSGFPQEGRVVGEVKLWDAATGKEAIPLQSNLTNVTSVCFSPDSKLVAAGRGEYNVAGVVKVWDTKAGQETATLQGHFGEISSICFSPDGKRVASGSFDRTARIWDLATRRELLVLKAQTRRLYSVCFSPDGRRLATGGEDSAVRIWDAETGADLLAFKGHTDFVFCVRYSPDGTRVATGSKDMTARVWDANKPQDYRAIVSHSGNFRAHRFGADSKSLVTGGSDGTLRIWDATTGRERRIFTGHVGFIDSVCFSQDGSLLASGAGVGANYGNTSGELKIWNALTGQPIRDLKGHTSLVSSVCFGPDGKQLASASFDKTARLWDVDSGRELLTLKGHSGELTGVCISPDGKHVATSSWDNTAKIWDAATGQEQFTLKGHTNYVRNLAYSPDGKRLATASWDKTAKLWDTATGQEIRSFKGHTDMVLCVSFSADGQRLGTTCYDATAKLWDVDRGQEVLTLQNAGTVGSFSPDGKRLVTGMGATVKIWDSEEGE